MSEFRMMVDVDSTLYDADKLFYQLAIEAGIDSYPRKSYQWFRAGELGVSQQTLTNLFRKAHSREEVEKLKPYKGSVEVLNRFADDHPNVEIHYVSSRNARAQGPLLDWIKDNGFPLQDDAHVVATMDKKSWIIDNQPDIVIDDRVQTMIFSRYGGSYQNKEGTVGGTHPGGSWVLSLKHSHNINLTNEVDGIFMCDDWFEIGYNLGIVMKNLEVTGSVRKARSRA